MAFRRNNRNYNNNRRPPNPRRREREACPGPRRQSNVTVVARKDEPAEKLIRRFVRKCKKERIIEQVRENRYFEKPSDEKRRKFAERRREEERHRKKIARKQEAYRKRQAKQRRLRAKGGGTNGSTR
jgi:small subunit ribosomal protein S21